MNHVFIRPAARADFESLCRLYFEFHEFHVRGVPDRLRSLGEPESYDCAELYDSLERIIADDWCILHVAEIEKRSVGFAEAYIRIDESDSKRISYKYCRLQSLMVGEEFRRRRIGALLTKRVEQWAGEKGCTEVRLDVWEFGQGPLKFYEHAGYRTIRRTMVRRL